MKAATARNVSARQLAVGLAGYSCFINLYSPQAILPLLSQDFHAGAAEISTIITAARWPWRSPRRSPARSPT